MTKQRVVRSILISVVLSLLVPAVMLAWEIRGHHTHFHMQL